MSDKNLGTQEFFVSMLASFKKIKRFDDSKVINFCYYTEWKTLAT